MHMVLWKFCTFVADSGFPKRTTFLDPKTKKFSKTDNFALRQAHKH